MKYIIKFSVVVVFFLCLYINTGNSNPRTGTIIISVTGLENNNGIVRSHIFNINRSEFFPTKSDSCYRKTTSFAHNNKAQIVYKNIPYGTYAVTVHHDINNNGKMDLTFIGYPDEGFGLSKNPKIGFSIPKFEECKFSLTSPHKKLNIELKFAD